MAIEVTARGQVSRSMPEGRTELAMAWSGPISVRELLKDLNIDLRLVVVVVNGHRVDAEHMLEDGDRVLLFAPMAGGDS